MKFNEKLQNLRKEKKFSQEQLADLLEVSRQSVSKWESGQTYPEMDKLISLCKIFNCTLDDLTNDEVDLNKKEIPNSFDNAFQELKNVIDKTVLMFMNMNLNSFIKFFISILLLLIIIGIIRIPFEIIIDLGHNTFSFFGSTVNNILSSLWRLIIESIYIFASLYLFIYVYKVHILDKVFLNIKLPVEEENNNINNEKAVSSNRVTIPNNLNHLGKVVINLSTIVIKIFIFLMLLPLGASLTGLFVAFLVLIGLVFHGVWYFGLIILLLALIILNIVFFEVLGRLFLNLPNKFSKNLFTIILAIAILGLGISISLFEITSTNIYNEAPHNIKTITDTREIIMTDDLTINSHGNYGYGYYKIEFIEDEALTNNIIVRNSFYDKFISSSINVDNNNISFSKDFSTNTFKETINIIIDNLKKKNIYNYEKLTTLNIQVIGNKKNLTIINNNNQKAQDAWLEGLRQSERNEHFDLINRYERQVSELEYDNTLLKEKIEELEDKINSFKNQTQDIFN